MLLKEEPIASRKPKKYWTVGRKETKTSKAYREGDKRPWQGKEFCTLHYGEEKAQEIIDAVFDHLAILESPDHDFSKIGSVDEDFAHLRHAYRKLIMHHCKITYREGKAKIFVIRIFDARQDPTKNK